MARETILYTNPDFLWKTATLNLVETGAVFTLVMHIAMHGPVDNNRKTINKIVKIGRGNRFPDVEHLNDFFVVGDDNKLSLNDELFYIRYRGSDRARINTPKAVRLAVHERDGYRCVYCNNGDGPFHVDHIHPVSRGGSNDIDNLCLACADCNRSKSNKLVSEWKPEVTI